MFYPVACTHHNVLSCGMYSPQCCVLWHVFTTMLCHVVCTHHNVLPCGMYSPQCSVQWYVLTTMLCLVVSTHQHCPVLWYVLTTMFCPVACTHHNVLSRGIHVVDGAGDDDGALLEGSQAGVSVVGEAYPAYREDLLIGKCSGHEMQVPKAKLTAQVRTSL